VLQDAHWQYIGDPSLIRCKLQNDPKKPCLNGAGCLYKHGPLGADTSNGAGSSSNQCAQPALSPDRLWLPRRLRSPSKRKRRHYPQFKFDSTLGYPGEGPAKIICYNINGAKNKLASILSEARREGVQTPSSSRKFTTMPITGMIAEWA
jgi:hypothetical protein